MPFPNTLVAFAISSPYSGDTMPFPAVVIANEFLRIAEKERSPLTPMKLQKLVYFAHGWCLALTGQPLITERIEAWQYGPVIPSLYGEFKLYGNGPITEPAYTVSFNGGKVQFYQQTLDDFPDTPEKEFARQVIRRVWEVYGGFTTAKLSNATHLPGTPWSEVYEDGKRSVSIPDEKIKAFFEAEAHAK
jgi:uncharacterized phage-associated protein